MTGTSTVEDAIAALEGRRLAAMQANDVDAIAAFIHDDCIYTHSRGERDTRDSYLEKCRSGFIRYIRLRTAIERIVVRGDVAIVVAAMDGDAELAGAPRRLHNCYTAVWARDAADWQLVAFQPTPILD